jgi:hypothetical protein
MKQRQDAHVGEQCVSPVAGCAGRFSERAAIAWRLRQILAPAAAGAGVHKPSPATLSIFRQAGGGARWRVVSSAPPCAVPNCGVGRRLWQG